MSIQSKSVVLFVVGFIVMIVAGSAFAFPISVRTTVTVTNNTDRVLWVRIDLREDLWKELPNGQSDSFTYNWLICPRHFVARIGTYTTSEDMIIQCLDADGGNYYDQCSQYPTGDLCKSSSWSITKGADGKLKATKQ